uniref:RIIa domain-containing protein n=1 Tax=Graphocephala atropunctata TaxID=36148 RepID=A0A1B6LB21_9HEMI
MTDVSYLSIGSDGLEGKDQMPGQKKSILVAPGSKRMSRKATLHFKEEDLKDKLMESGDGASSKLSWLEYRGTRWNRLRDLALLLQADKAWPNSYDVDEDRPKDPRFLRALGLGGTTKTHPGKRAELTPNQEVNLALLKLKVKMDNDDYLLQHPELAILLELVYRQLVKKRPENPKLFVAEYVHHLNLNRDELELEEFEVPFDRPLEPPGEDEDIESVSVFARKLVERCAAIASRGVAFVNVSNIIESMLRVVSPSVDLEEPKRSAVVAVSEIVTSLLMTVAVAGTKSAELVADEVLETILENLQLSVKSASEIYLEVREDVERFVRGLVKKVTAKAMKQVKTKEMMSMSTDEEDSDERDDEILKSYPSKSILKKEPEEFPPSLHNVETDERPRQKKSNETRVRFQSL